MHPDYHSVYHVEVSKLVGKSWLFFPSNTIGILGRSRDRSLPRSSVFQANLGGSIQLFGQRVKFCINFRGILDPALGAGVSKGCDVVGHQQNLFNSPLEYDVIPQSVQKVQPPCAEHIVRED